MKKIVVSFLYIIINVMSTVFADAPVVDYSEGATVTTSSVARSFPLKAESGFSSQQALSGNFSIEQRVLRMERQISNLNEQNLSQRVEELQQRLQRVTGQLDEQAHQIEQLSNQIKEFYSDLQKRLASGEASSTGSLESKASAKIVVDGSSDSLVNRQGEVELKEAKSLKRESQMATSAPVAVSSDNPDTAFLKEQQLYQTAIDLLPDKKYVASENKLREYLKTYPEGVYVANAHYWLGEINFLQKNFDAAEEEFKIVVDKYPKSKRALDAKLKQALVHQHQGREAQAKVELQQIVKKYPGTGAAQLAKKQLTGV